MTSNTNDTKIKALDSEEDHITPCFEFDQLGLDERILRGVREQGFQRCTLIQARSLPFSLQGYDILGKAQTGTGKTAAFLLTIFQRLLGKPQPEKVGNGPAHPLCLIMAPTRELAIQIENDAQKLGQFTGIGTTAIVGGVEYDKQFQALAENPQIIVATPGRLIELYKDKRISFRSIRMCVIDEADRMFDLGFFPDIRYILRQMPSYDKRQTLLFSATLSFRVTELSYEFMNSPYEIDASEERIVVENIEEGLYHVSNDEKLPLLLGVLPKETRVMIFTNMKSTAEWLGFKLQGNGFSAEVLTGDVDQKKRLNVVKRFKEGTTCILVATDVASRGLHMDDIALVVNYDLPEDPENYVHRIGRTGRAGQKGKAMAFACEKHVYALPDVEKYIGHKIPIAHFSNEDLKRDEAPAFRSERGGNRGHRPQGRKPQGGNRDHHKGRGGRDSRRGRR